MKSQNKKPRPEKQVKQEKLPGEQGQLAKAGDAVSTTSVTTASTAAVTAKSSSAKNSSGKSASIQVMTERANYEKLIFTVAITASLVLHALALLVHFVMPKTVDNKPRDADLEIILVNSKHAKRPVNAEALAQADLDGGGAHDSGRSKSPLPDMKRSEDGDALQTNTRKIAELEEQQKQLMDQAKLKDDFRQQNRKRKILTKNPGHLPVRIA